MELTTQKIIISDVFKSTKGNIPLINKNKFLVQYKTTVTAGLDVKKAKIKETDDEIRITIPHCTINEDENTKIMSKDEYLITDAPLKALTVFAMPMILGSFFSFNKYIIWLILSSLVSL